MKCLKDYIIEQLENPNENPVIQENTQSTETNEQVVENNNQKIVSGNTEPEKTEEK